MGKGSFTAHFQQNAVNIKFSLFRGSKRKGSKAEKRKQKTQGERTWEEEGGKEVNDARNNE